MICYTTFICAFRLVNNLSWYKDENVIKFLTDFGRYFRLTYMLRKERLSFLLLINYFNFIIQYLYSPVSKECMYLFYIIVIIVYRLNSQIMEVNE